MTSMYLVESYIVNIKLIEREFPDYIREKISGVCDIITLHLGARYFNTISRNLEVITDINVSEDNSICIVTDISIYGKYNIGNYDVYTLAENILRSKIFKSVSLTESNCKIDVVPSKYICICHDNKEREFIKISDDKFFNDKKILKETKSGDNAKSSYEYIAIITDNSSNCNLNISVDYHKIIKITDRIYRIDTDLYNHINIDYPMIGLDINKIIIDNA